MQDVSDIRSRVRQLKDQTERALSGQPVGIHFEALFTVFRNKRLDPRYILDHLAGYEMDATVFRCTKIEQTLQYAYHVAGTVGLMMAQIMGVRRREHLQYAVDLGIAFQLTNIARDVVEDAGAGRCYLPEDWLVQAGLNCEDISNPDAFRLFQKIAQRLLDHAEPFYASARSGLAILPTDCLWGILSATEVYHDISRSVRQSPPEVWAARVSTSRPRKISLIAQSYVVARTRQWKRMKPDDRSALWTPSSLRSPQEA